MILYESNKHLAFFYKRVELTNWHSNLLLIIQLGIEVRRQKLVEHNCDNEEVRKEIDSSFNFLVDPNQMGERFKFFSIFPKTMGQIHQKFPPVGFYPPRDKQ
jgi:SAM-dependent MidA family methyltransferase